MSETEQSVDASTEEAESLSYREMLARSQAERKRWLESLKIGDQVARHFGSYEIQQVTGITATRIRIGTDEFNKSDGQLRGADSWTRGTMLYQVTKDIVDEIDKYKLVARLRGINWNKIDIDALREIAILLDKKKQ